MAGRDRHRGTAFDGGAASPHTPLRAFKARGGRCVLFVFVMFHVMFHREAGAEELFGNCFLAD